MDKYFILKQIVPDDGESEDDEADESPSADSDDEKRGPNADAEEGMAEHKRRTARYGEIFRGKGFAWLANPKRSPYFAQWSQAGNLLTFSFGGTWDEFPVEEGKQPAPAQTLVFVGQHLKKDRLREDLDALLLTDREQEQLALHEKTSKRAKKAVKFQDVFVDPFEPFPVPDGAAKQVEHVHSAACAHEPVQKKRRTQK